MRFEALSSFRIGAFSRCPLPASITSASAIELEIGPVFVEPPGLAHLADGEKVPHTCAENEPCLFYQPYREWWPEMPIALTIVPRLLEWLLYHEAWLATGEWLGGGVHIRDGVLVAESTASSG